MANILKCKICGGDIEKISKDIAVCQYCGSKQILPKMTSERKVNLYDRANHYRSINEFDKAMAVYEQVLAEDDSDAEVYWDLVLCRYGIEYVEDPRTKKRIPTVNRTQFQSIFDDRNYLSALDHASDEQREIIKADAEVIDRIQKGILEISSHEQPYDIFICYKETDDNGRRTPDSVIAQDMYNELTKEGYKVFFSRITLEDKLGSAYEPYIFAALNSAKVMIAIGTKPEYFNAVWVKNEWSRYLGLISVGEKKTLIPAYKDMDPYDLPEEFSHLQAQDMGKLGFMQDLIRGVNKIIRPMHFAQPVVSNSIDVNAYKTRIEVFLDNKDFNSAKEYCDKVLDILPQDGETYVLKLCAEVGVSSIEELSESKHPFDNKATYSNAIKYSNNAIRTTLENSKATVNARVSRKRKKLILLAVVSIVLTVMICILTYATPRIILPQYNLYKTYRQGKTLLSEGNYTEAYKTFVSLGDYRDSSQMAEQTIYEKALSYAGNGDYDHAISTWESIINYKDSKDQIEQAKKNKYDAQYQEALKLKEDKQYEQAINIFKTIEEYDDSSAQIKECQYMRAYDLFEEGKYSTASSLFSEISGYEDSETMAKECKYLYAKSLFDYNSYSAGISVLMDILGYKDVNELLIEYINSGLNSGISEVTVEKYQHNNKATANTGIEAHITFSARKEWESSSSYWSGMQHCYTQIQVCSNDTNEAKDLICLYVTNKEAYVVDLGEMKSGDGATLYVGDAKRPTFIYIVVMDKNHTVIGYTVRGI